MSARVPPSGDEGSGSPRVASGMDPSPLAAGREDAMPVNDDASCICGHPLYQHDDGKDKCGICETCARFVEGCLRWGFGPDRCIRYFDHVGPCEDAQGNTTLTLAAAILERDR